MMRHIAAVTAIVVCFSTFSSASVAFGQKPTRFEPARPTFSPYLNFFRRDYRGPLPQYQGQVLPPIQLRRTITRQESAIGRTEKGLKKQGEEIKELGGELKKIRESGVSPTGTGSSFMNLSHYYRSATSGR